MLTSALPLVPLDLAACCGWTTLLTAARPRRLLWLDLAAYCGSTSLPTGPAQAVGMAVGVAGKLNSPAGTLVEKLLISKLPLSDTAAPVHET